MRQKENKIIQVFEHRPITTEKGRYPHKMFTEELHQAFEFYYQANENTPFFKLIPHGIKFTEYVGAIHIGKITIEVLPKAGKIDNKETWQKVLLEMLKTCHLLTARETGNAPLKLKANSILELYFELYLAELEKLLHQGLIKKYRKYEGQQKALKGALVFSKHTRQNLVHKERFYTRHTVYDKDHMLHQILAEALHLVEHLSSSTLLRDRIGRLKLDFPEVSSLRVKAQHFERIQYNRKTTPYRKALEIAKLLLLNYRPDIRSGRQDLLAIMFDMNVLWEEYIYRVLRRDLKGWLVKPQRSKPFWESRTIRPDIVLEKEGMGKYIIDTKWKVLYDSRPAIEDLKQMYVYNHYWESRKSLLLYPRAHTMKDFPGNFRLQLNNKDHSCTVGFVDVVDKECLKRNIAHQVELKLEKVVK